MPRRIPIAPVLFAVPARVNTGFNIIHAKIERQGFGRFWLATEAVQELAGRLLP